MGVRVFHPRGTGASGRFAKNSGWRIAGLGLHATMLRLDGGGGGEFCHGCQGDDDGDGDGDDDDDDDDDDGDDDNDGGH